MDHTQEYLKSLWDHPTRFMNKCFMREIMYDYENNVFIDLTSDEGFEYIDNIFTEILPTHVELMRAKLEDMVVKDRHGRLTLLTLMPFVD